MGMYAKVRRLYFRYLPFSQAGGALLFHLLSKLHERTSVIITTDLTFSEWSSVFVEPNHTQCRHCGSGDLPRYDH